MGKRARSLEQPVLSIKVYTSVHAGVCLGTVINAACPQGHAD